MGVTRGASLATEIDAAVWTKIAFVAGMSFGSVEEAFERDAERVGSLIEMLGHGTEWVSLSTS